MRANPGGQISPVEVIGRDKQIGRLWAILERQSLVLSAERRMGKTCIVKKMMAEAPPDMLLIYHDLEGLRSPLEFALDSLPGCGTLSKRFEANGTADTPILEPTLRRRSQWL